MKNGDEIIAIDGLRVSDSKSLKKLLTGRSSTSGIFTISSHGKLTEVKINIQPLLEYPVLFEGKGNDLWNSMKKSRI